MQSVVSVVGLLLSSLFLSGLEGGEHRGIACDVRPIDRASIHPNGDYYSTELYSTNWSGYVAAKNLNSISASNNTVSAVSGFWVVPTLRATGTAYSAIWVGIDGYSSPTVEQIGTSHNWINGGQQDYVWFEMYPNGAYEIVGFPLRRGDVIAASVTYIAGGIFKMIIINETQGVGFAVPSNYTFSPAAKRSSAEWIVEAPYSGGVLPLADFQLASFSNCLASIGSTYGGTISSSSWQNDEVVMLNYADQLKAVPSALKSNGTAFTVQWDRSQ